MNEHTSFAPGAPSSLFTVADIEVVIDSEPRIKDVLLADRLGYRRSRTIRELIERNRPELEAYGDVAVRHGAVETGNGTIKEVTEFLLNEHQSLLLCMFSKTDLAAAVRKALIDVFVAYRRAHLERREPVDGIASMMVRERDAVGFLRAIASRPPNLRPAKRLEVASLTRRKGH